MQSKEHIIESQLLILHYRRGDQAALERFVDLWQQPLFFFIRRLTATEADAWDVLQETWERVLRGLDRLRDVECVAPWLYRIARNTAFNHRQHLAREEPLDDRVPEAAANAPHEPSFPAEAAEAVHRVLDKLPLSQREVLTLFFLDELSVLEIAAVVGVPPGTVKSRLHYGKKALHEVLRQEMGHE